MSRKATVAQVAPRSDGMPSRISRLELIAYVLALSVVCVLMRTEAKILYSNTGLQVSISGFGAILMLLLFMLILLWQSPLIWLSSLLRRQ